jgi:hypothetical protein
MPQPTKKMAVTVFPVACTSPVGAPGINAVSAGFRASENNRWSKQSNDQHADAIMNTNQ